MLRRLFPHPALSMMLVITWMLLVNEFKLGSLVFAVFLATVIPLLTAPYWPGRAAMPRPFSLIGYVLLVVWDILVSSLTVARIILFYRDKDIRSAWIAVPIDLKSPEAIMILGATITLTPGTVTADVSSCGRALLVHALHAPDPDAVRDEIKSRYEPRLKRIFG